MKSTLLRLFVLIAMAGFGMLPAFAQSDVTVPIEYLRPMKNSVSIGVRVMGGASVNFGGDIGHIALPDSNLASAAFRQQLYQSQGYITYNNGTLYKDSADASGNGTRPAQTEGIAPGSNGRWITRTTVTSTNSTSQTVTVVNGDYLPYDASGNTTRNWSATNQGQRVTNGSNTSGSGYGLADNTDGVMMAYYEADGIKQNSVHADAKASPGVEIQVSRVLQRFKHFEWGFNFTFGVSQFNAKTSQSVAANIKRYADVYQVYAYNANANGIKPGALVSGTGGGYQMSGPSFTDLGYTDADGNAATFSSGKENTTPLSTTPVWSSSNDGEELGSDTGAVINGYWQVKGTYYLARIGPMIRIPIGRHFSATLSTGYMAAYVGSKFRFDETLSVPDQVAIQYTHTTLYDTTGADTVSVTDSKYNQTFKSGFYVDANMEWWLSMRTGFYAGLMYENLGKYRQNFEGRTADVQLSKGLGVHFGIITRF